MPPWDSALDSSSTKAIHRVYPTGGQEAFLEGHIEAFHALGGIPTRHIRYDNLTSAVVQVIHGGDRLRDENERWVLFRSHYGFDAFYCQPGIDGAHEKGGVEGEVGWFRRNHLTPMPEVATLDELNDKIRAWEHDDNTRRITGHANTIGCDGGLALLCPNSCASPGHLLDRVARTGLSDLLSNLSPRTSPRPSRSRRETSEPPGRPSAATSRVRS